MPDRRTATTCYSVPQSMQSGRRMEIFKEWEPGTADNTMPALCILISSLFHYKLPQNPRQYFSYSISWRWQTFVLC